MTGSSPTMDGEKKKSEDLEIKKRISSEKRGSKEIEGNNISPLAPVIEVNEYESPSKLLIEEEFVEIGPKLFGRKEVSEPITIPTLNNAFYELGVINLCWPEIKDPVFETRTCFPVSYYTNTKKEKLLLAYAENFRKQFLFHYQMRKPLLLQAPNECGLMKMICTTIRPTKLCFSDTITYEGISALVADFFDYEPLTKPMLHPERIMSPYTCIIRRSGNPFELAHVLVSWLIGAHYDAYVVVGCAVRDTCMAIRYRTECPDIPKEIEEEKSEEPEEEPKYRLVPLPDLTSKYLKEMEIKEAEKIQAEKDQIEAAKLERIAELEKAPPDEIDGWRTHAWAIILPGFNGIEEPFFIEPSEGNAYPLDCRKYQHIDSIYNHENYYANLQKCDEGLETISYDLCDLACWEHLLSGEPFHRRNFVGVDTSDKKTAVTTEKHLDMPASWVERLDITADEHEQRYPGSHKTIHYKKVLLEKYSRYSQQTGIVKSVKTFEDYALTKPLMTYEWYDNRSDLMMTTVINHVEKKVVETFKIGRKDHLIKHEYTFAVPATSVEGERTLTFNYYARLDHLSEIKCGPTSFDEYYTDREDKLESRCINFFERPKEKKDRKEKRSHHLQPEVIRKRHLKDITETFSRNPDKPSKDDIWRRKFLIPEHTIEILYHYEYNFVTNDNRTFIKPNLAETGGKILFYPDKTYGYIADPNAKLPRPLDIYYTLCDNMAAERLTQKHIRDRETDVVGYLKDRFKEITEPTLFVSLFDTERNEEAKKGWKEQETQKAEITERETEAAIDPLAPYLARMFGSGHGSGSPLTLKEASLIREQCINDFKNKQMARQVLVQERFDKLNAEYKNKRLWYLAHQFILTPEKESSYFAMSAELAFQVHALEVRLSRHRDLSGPRYKVLEKYLNQHPLLVELNKLNRYYRK